VTPEAVVADGNRCGEGPIWDAARRRLVWDDNAANLVFEYKPATGERNILSRDLMVSGIALDRSGALVFGGSGGLHLWYGYKEPRMLVAGLPINDMIADPQGRVYAGTIHWTDKMEKPGTLYLIDRDARVYPVDEGIELANGLGFSPDNRTLYFTDSAARRIYAYDVGPVTGDLTRKRVFVQIPTTEGLPDGLTVDRDGFVWSAQWYGGQVVRYDPDGKVERRLAMPVSQVSSVAFGGEDLGDLYITTAADPWPSPLAPPGWSADAPTGGSLYRVRLDVPGKPEHLARLG
jgi:D-xylonolactonase